ncbi:MAG: transposase [Gammaproteobacteria bacterium]
MARPLRLELAGGLYHITSRGDRREDIYDDDEDREQWLEILSKTCSRFNWRCHAYCLMDNHYHMVIETAEDNLSKGMRQLNGVYTQYYNRRHNRVGHVFQGRFKGILVDRDEYLLELSRYVVLNPLRARMTKNIESWKWSSYKAITGKVSAPPWLETDWILGQFSKQRKRAIQGYINFVRAGVGLPSIWVNLKNQVFLGGDHFVNKLQKRINKKSSLDEISRLQKRKIPKSLEYYNSKYKDEKKAIVAAYLTGGYTLKEIGDYYGKHYSTISRLVKEHEM